MNFNGADTRAKLIDPAIHKCGWTEDLIRREETAGTVEIINGKARRRSRGKIDYVLRIKVNVDTQPVALALIEAKKESHPPGHGLDQAKGYSECKRLHVKFVFSSNGHRFVEFDCFTGKTSPPKPIAEFPFPAELRLRYEQGMGFPLDSPVARPLLQPYSGGEGTRRYYQDAAIRAVMEKIAQCEISKTPKRALLSLATGAGKTFIAVNLLRRISDAGQPCRALFVCDRDELRTQALKAFQNVFGSDAAEVFRKPDGTNNAKNARIHIATYQTLGVENDNDDATFLTTFYPEDYFSHIVIDECHRSAWGKWSKVLERNRSAVQIGLTATPRKLEERLKRQAVNSETDTMEQLPQEAEAVGVAFRPSLAAPYRWRDWGAPPEDSKTKDTKPGEEVVGWKRAELKNAAMGSFFNFINTDLLPHLKALKNRPDASARQKVISEIMTGVERVRIDTERNFLDVLDKVHQLTTEAVDDTHVFTLSQVYEGLLLKMGEKGNDGGQFFTPRQVIKAMVQAINPGIDDTVYDPGCGTGGFLAQSFEHIKANLGNDGTADQLETLKQRTFWGREKENLIYPVALANLVLHGIDKPNLWHGNTLTGQETYGGLFEDAPQTFDVILTNPPFGGKEGKEAQTNFDYKTGATQVLFLQHVIRNLREGGRCGIVLDEGLLFRTNEDGFVKTKRKLLDDCDLWCLVSLPGGVFTAAGAGVKTNLFFFTKGRPTRKIWYYDLSDIKVRKKIPLTLKHFEDFLRLLPSRADSELSWTVDMDERKRVATEEARPFKEQSTAKGQQAAQWNERLKDLKKAKPLNDKAIADADTKVKELNREARGLAAKAKEIEDAVYDLKAVNPNKKPEVDNRTPEELMEIIETKGREVAEALAVLRNRG